MIRIERDGEVFEIRDKIPLLPLRDVVIYPYMTIPLLVGRVASVNAIEAAVQRDRVVFVLAQKRPEVADPASKDLYRVGTVVRVLQLFRLPDGTMRVLVEGICRGRGKKFFTEKDWMSASVGIVKDDLMVRVGPHGYEEALKQPHARPMDFTGKPMAGYVFVASDGTAEDEDLEHWVQRGASFAATLTGKTKRPRGK